MSRPVCCVIFLTMVGVAIGCASPRSVPPPADDASPAGGTGGALSPPADAAPMPTGAGGAPTGAGGGPTAMPPPADTAPTSLDGSADAAIDTRPPPDAAPAPPCPGAGCPPLAAAMSLAAGGAHTCANLADGTTRCWGGNNRAQLGSPASVRFTRIPALVPELMGARALSVGSLHSCAIGAQGQVLCWGDNGYGQLGDGRTAAEVMPTPIAVPGLGPASMIASGCDHTCALLASGDVRCWGNNFSSQTGPDFAAAVPPRLRDGLPPTSAIAAGCLETCAIVAGGAIKCWGGFFGPDPGDVPGLTGARSLAVGAQAQPWICILGAAGRVTCWSRQLQDQAVPIFEGASAVAAGPAQVCAIIAGAVHCTSGGTSSTPVAGIAGASALAIGGKHACAIVAGGDVRCWGEGAQGQNGGTSHSPTALPVPGW